MTLQDIINTILVRRKPIENKIKEKNIQKNKIRNIIRSSIHQYINVNEINKKNKNNY